MRGGVFRELAVLNPIAANAIGERRSRLGFFGVDAFTNTQHALCSLEARAADETSRRGQFVIRLNRGNDGMEPPVDTLVLDADGNLRLFNELSQQTFSVDSLGNVNTQTTLTAATLTSTSQLKVGDALVLDASGIKYSDSSGVGGFTINGTNQTIVSTYDASFTNVNVMGDLAVADKIFLGKKWRLIEINEDELFVQKNVNGVWTDKFRLV